MSLLREREIVVNGGAVLEKDEQDVNPDETPSATGRDEDVVAVEDMESLKEALAEEKTKAEAAAEKTAALKARTTADAEKTAAQKGEWSILFTGHF